MSKFSTFIKYTILFSAIIFLTVVTQIGGVILLLTYHLTGIRQPKFKGDKFIVFLILYSLFCFLVVPLVAPIFGRNAISNRKHLRPATYFTILCNRNYVNIELNETLEQTADNLEGANSDIKIYYLDANFPFFDGFPLFPHLSHNDGKKIDISFVYEDKAGLIANSQKSNSGYGVFEEPKDTEINQFKKCKSAGYWQYDYSKYFTFGTKNNELLFSEEGTKQLIMALLKSDKWGKLFIEPHLKQRLNLTDARVRFHGCGAVRHDDHIHIQLQ